MTLVRGFAVVDVETTGISVGYRHRVVEVAVVQLDLRGLVTDSWVTLVNPDRDMGPQHIHGVSAREARRAPSFKDVAGDVAERLAGRILVGHNVEFDLEHLAAEFRRAGVEVDWSAVPALCTMRLASRWLPAGSGRSLLATCRELGIDLVGAHTALADAAATAALFSCLVPSDSFPSLELLHLDAAAVRWPALASGLVAPMSRPATEAGEPHWLTQLVDRLPRTQSPEVNSYLAVLDRVVLDRYVSEDEAEELIELAFQLGIHRADALTLHQGYLHAVAREALADHVLTGTEREDLLRLADALGLAPEEVDRALAHPSATLAGFVPTPRLQLRRGTVVVFTGQTRRGEPEWVELLAAAGVKVDKRVTKRTELLVAADLDSASGNAKRARLYDVPIVGEDCITALLAELAPAGLH